MSELCCSWLTQENGGAIIGAVDRCPFSAEGQLGFAKKRKKEKIRGKGFEWDSTSMLEMLSYLNYTSTTALIHQLAKEGEKN